MIRSIVVLLLANSLFAIELSMLTNDKQEMIRYKNMAIEAEEGRGKYDWIGSFSLGASINENRAVGSSNAVRNEEAHIGFAQDLFRSGAIIESVRLAKRRASRARIALEQELCGYLLDLATNRIYYEIDTLRLLQNDKQLKNSEIKLLVKKRQYEVGIADITELNDAIRTKNSISKERLDLIQTRANRSNELAKLTPLNVDEVEIPRYEMVDLERFVASSFAVLLAQSEEWIWRSEKVMARSNYLPKLTFNAKYGWQTVSRSNDGDFYSYGLSLSMPLDVTSFAAVEEKRANEIKARFARQNAIAEAEHLYKQQIDLIQSKEKSIALLRENIDLYDELIVITKRLVAVGEKSRFDLEMLENSREVDSLEIKINNLQLEIERAKIHYMVSLNRGVK